MTINGMTLEEILKDLRTKPTIPVWPHVGKLLDLSRGSVYAAAHSGEIDVIIIGRRMLAVSAPLRRRLGLEAA
jgi:hypothetical protein